MLRHAVGLLFLSGAVACTALSADESGSSNSHLTNSQREAKVATKLHAIRTDAKAVEAFLTAMPKGADLHNHLTGAIYAEKLLEWAKRDGLCIDTTQDAAVFKSDCAKPTSVPMPSPGEALYDELVSAWSMDGFQTGGAESGHDHFFNAFNKFGLATIGHNGEMLADVAQRAAKEHVSYLELMAGIAANEASKVSDKVWNGKARARRGRSRRAPRGAPREPRLAPRHRRSEEDPRRRRGNVETASRVRRRGPRPGMRDHGALDLPSDEDEGATSGLRHDGRRVRDRRERSARGRPEPRRR